MIFIIVLQLQDIAVSPFVFYPSRNTVECIIPVYDHEGAPHFFWAQETIALFVLEFTLYKPCDWYFYITVGDKEAEGMHQRGNL